MGYYQELHGLSSVLISVSSTEISGVESRGKTTYVFRPAIDFAGVAVGYGLEARATTARMAVPRGYFGRLDTYKTAG